MRICDTEEFRTALGLFLALGSREVGHIVYPEANAEPLDDVKMSKQDKNLENFYCSGL